MIATIPLLFFFFNNPMNIRYVYKVCSQWKRGQAGAITKSGSNEMASEDRYLLGITLVI